MRQVSLAILGAGNIGSAIALGLTSVGALKPQEIVLTRRHPEKLQHLQSQGCLVTPDNRVAVQAAQKIMVCVEPQQLDMLLDEIAAVCDPRRHLLISMVSGVRIARIQKRLGQSVPVLRAMPNTAIRVGESMTCLAGLPGAEAQLAEAVDLFASVGTTLVIDEELMTPATALGACGVAFFLRAIRAASQGGIEIGFHAEEALAIAAQTARGAATLVQRQHKHPEREIDRVTTPRGCTIAGLNQMEHLSFSSAMIRGIVTSAEKAERLYER